ncbi:MAG TPA: O-antigen ligase family protein [Actinomycetota bacterium]|nr:O-antigen ligase family protein [Actinomycetota bacterium]
MGIGLPRVFAPGAPVSELALILTLTLGIAFGALAGKEVSTARYILGGLGGIIFFLIASSGRITALRLIMIWLVMLGLIRRFLIPFAGWSPNDPLLLVGPACAFLIWLNGRQNSPKKLDAITLITLFFMFWVGGQIFNPNQSSIMVGLQGALFWFPSLLWLMVGRTFPLKIHRSIIHLLMVLSIPVALHGLYQTYVGLLPFEYTWVGVSGFGESIFYAGFKVRSFSTLVSPEEYGIFLSVMCMFWWSKILMEEKDRIWRIPLFGFLVWALFLQGSRGIFLFFMVGIFVTGLMRLRGFPARLALVGVAVMGIGLASQAEPPKEQGAGADQVVNHQLRGLLDPFSEEGTGPLHLRLVRDGFERSWENPFGLGPASTTLVSKRATGDTFQTENDLSTVFVAFGILMGVTFTMFIVILYSVAGRRFRLNRNWYTLAVVGMLVAATSRTWAGSHYAVTSIIWFTLGGLCRPVEEISLDHQEVDQAEVDQASELTERELEPALAE